MRITLLLLLLIFTAQIVLSAQNNLEVNSPKDENPLGEYLNEMDEIGRTLSGWHGAEPDVGSWFFSSYAMLILMNNGRSDLRPFPTLETLVPGLWGDLKYLTPRTLMELAGGALSYGDLMSISQDRPFGSLRTEEKFIIQVAGSSHLRMLQSTVGEQLFDTIVTAVIAGVNDPAEITNELSEQVSRLCGADLGLQFSRALSSGTWMDVELTKVRRRGDSTDVFLKQKGSWSFPCDVLMITGSGDSTVYNYALGQAMPLTVIGQDYTRIILDPDHKLAEYYRYNNKWPRIKGNIYVQPFVALPDWEFFRITISPGSWSDWDGNKRYSLKLNSGFGMDLWPAYPSDYRHRISLELNSYLPMDASHSWGGRLSYAHPLSREKRLFANFRMHTYTDWNGMSLGLTKYVGKQRFLIQGPKLRYQRLHIRYEQDQYADSLIWQKDQSISIIKASYTGLSLTRYGDRLYWNLRTATGRESLETFFLMKSQVDISGVFWNWLSGGLQIEAGSQSVGTPVPYQFTHDYAWQDNLAALPKFRGQSRITGQPKNYVGVSISGGYWVSWFQVKLFASSMIHDQAGISLSEASPHHAAGFGFEHKSLFTAGLYFPIWQSHPLEGEASLAWRYQWRLSWNL
ncbi:MAG: hypothetical protein U9Q77_10695 [Candidatus Marinimicrobia bacterium]|nr:hypothetical protein [Candidatus Neomarinimicrobiota bacterium]